MPNEPRRAAAPAHLPCRRAGHRAGGGAFGRQCLPRPVRRPDHRHRHPGSRRVDGRAAPVGRWHHSGKQHRPDRCVGRLVDRGRSDLHHPRAGDHGLLAGLQVLVGARHRRYGRPAWRVVLGAAAALDDRRRSAAVPRRQGGGRSAQGRRKSRPGLEDPGHLRRHRCAGQAGCGQRPARDSRHLGAGYLPGQQPAGGLYRHQPVAGAAGRGLHRRVERGHRGAVRLDPVLAHRHPAVPAVLHGLGPGPGAEPGRCVGCRCSVRHLGREDSLPRCRRHVDRWRVDLVLAA